MEIKEDFINFTRLIRGRIFKDIPLYVHYGITHRCNLSCRMCNIYKDAGKNGELSTSEIGEKFDFLRRLGVVYVSIGGGEPFLRTDLVSVVNLLRKKGLMVRLLTNGTLAEEFLIKQLVSAGLRDVSVSLDTLDPEKQEYIYNSKGVFAKIMKAMELFSAYIPQKGRLLLINTVVSPFNIKELPGLALFAKKKGYYISFVPVESNGFSEFDFGGIDHKEIDKSYDSLIRMKKEDKSPVFNSSLFLDVSRDYLKFKQHKWKCDAGRMYFSMNPAGKLSICHKFKAEECFLNEDKRLSLIKGCSGCMRPCWAEVSFLMKDKKSFWEMARIKIT